VQSVSEVNGKQLTRLHYGSELFMLVQEPITNDDSHFMLEIVSEGPEVTFTRSAGFANETSPDENCSFPADLTFLLL